MAGYSVGPPGGGDLGDLTRRAREAAPALDELRRKEEQRQAVEERGTTIEERQGAQRGDLADATARLSSALQANIGVLQAEVAAIDASTAALLRNAEARNAVAAAAGRPVTRAAVAAETGGSAPPVQSSAAVRAAEQRAELERLAISQQQQEAAAAVAAARAGAPRGTASPEAVLGAASQVQWTMHRQAIADLHERQGTSISGAGASAASAAEAEVTSRTRAHVQILEELDQKQRQATQAVNEAAASYANSANALQRHGALTTEFIQAFARGEVTLREFESQMVSTMGKFGGWAIAGGLVYGVFDAFKHLTRGATETQAAVQQLGRFIPGLGGPAGGGTGQVNAAVSTVRDISSQFNVPISEVTDAMQVMARTFHNVSDAGDATRAVLAAVRLDQVPQAQAEQYFIGISQSLGLNRGSDLIGVVNSLNALQAQYGARVAQTLPGIARAAPAAVAGGLDTPALEAMVALGVRAGLTGNQVGTAITRSITNFAFGPGATEFQRYGIAATPGDYGGLIRQVAEVIDTRTKAGTLRGQDLTNLARALGGPQLSRVFLPLLAQEEISPGALEKYIGTAQHPRNYQEDLSAVLGTVSERFKSIGIALENFGSRLAQSGFFQPFETGLQAVTTFIHAIEVLTNPLVHLASLFGQLPAPIRDVIGAFLLARGVRALYNTSFGSNVQGFIGRLPGLDALDTQPRQAIRSTVARLRNSVLPQAEREQATSSTRYLQAARQQESAAAQLAQYEQQNATIARQAGEDSEQYAKYKAEQAELESQLSQAERSLTRAAQRAGDSEAYTAQVLADIAVLTDSDYSTQQKINYLKERQLVALNNTVSAQEEALASARNIIGGGGGAATAAGIQAAVSRGAGTGTEAAKAAAVAVAGDAAVVGAATAALARSGTAARDVGQVAADAIASSPNQLGLFGAGGALPVIPAPVRAGATYTQEALPGFEESMAVSRTGLQNLAFAASTIGDQARGIAGRATDAATGLWGRVTEGGLSGVAGRLTSPGALLAATFATQVAGSTIGGGAGQWIQNVAGQGATGALIGSMIGKGPYGALIGGVLGTVAGSFQQSTGTGVSSAAGTGIGALIGGGLGLLGGPFAELSVPAGAGIGALVGGVIGSIVGGGTDKSKQDPAQQARLQAANAVLRAQSGGQALDPNVENDLYTAFIGSGSTAQQAQQRLQATVQRLTAEQQLYGLGTPQGQAANRVLSQVIAGAARQSATDPAAALQLLQTADQSRQQALQTQLQYRISTAGPGGALAQGAYIGGLYQQNYNQTWTPAIQQSQQDVSTLTTMYDKLVAQDRAGDLGEAGKKKLAATKQLLDSAKQGLTGLTAAASQAQQWATLNQQAAVQAGYQADIQTSGAQGQLAVAQAGGSQRGQLQAQLATLQRNLGITNQAQAKGLDPTKAAQDIATTQAQIIDTRNKITQYGLTQVQAQGQLAVSQVPAGDPVGQAQAQLRSLEQQYEYMRQHKEAFDPTQITQVLAQINDARKQAVDAAVQYGTQMNDLRTQIAQAQDFGDSLAAAQAGVAGAARDVAITQRGGTPQERAQARLNQLNAANQQQQAAYQRIGDIASRQSAQEWGDPVAQARTMMQAAQRQLAMARGFEEQNQALSNLANAQSQLHAALMQNVQAEGQLQQTLHTGDTVAQARDALNTAQQLMANAHGQQEVIQAEQAMAAAQVQMRQALAQRYQAQGQFAASLTSDPLKQIQDQIGGLVRALSVTQGPDARLQIQTQINQLKLQYQNQLVSQREGTIQFQLDMYQITSQQAINQLQDLLKLKNLTVQQRQEIASRIRQLQFADTQSGQFDLAPSAGNVNLPTVYDVHRLMRVGMVRQHPLIGATDQSQTIVNVDVRNANDVPAVADAIERTTGAKLKGRLRAAGMRGI